MHQTTRSGAVFFIILQCLRHFRRTLSSAPLSGDCHAKWYFWSVSAGERDEHREDVYTADYRGTADGASVH
jgi:hypothetical protein